MLIPKIVLTKEDILSKISEEDIFRKYSDFQEVGKKFFSPFKKERTPSCLVHPISNYLYFKDFSSGKTGNCLSLVMELENCTYQEALVIIKKDFNIKKDFSSRLISNKEYIPKITNIKIRSIDWNSKYLEYWEQYGISKETLIKFNIKPISHYWINYDRFKVEFGFAYILQDKFKILQPYDELWKWISNTNKDIVQGIEQLDYPKDIIVTSSLKDVAIIWEQLKIQAIAPNSENTMLPNWVIEKLKQLNTTIWFNSDEAGYLGASKYKDDFRIFNHNEELGKDPSDCVKNGYELEKIWNVE